MTFTLLVHKRVQKSAAAANASPDDGPSTRTLAASVWTPFS